MSAPPLRTPFVRRGHAIHVKIRVTPKAARNAIDGLDAAADGDLLLGARVTAAPEKDRANTALIKLLAAAWHLPPRRLALVRGATSRIKTVAIADADAELVQSLNAWAYALEST